MERKARKSLGGRPRTREPEAGDRVHLGIRVTPEMKQRLEEIAASTGRSQSQEAEYRLARSFDREELLPEVLTLAYGREAAGLLMMIGLIMKMVGDELHLRTNADDGPSWTDNSVAVGNVAHAVLALLDAVKPDGRAVNPQVGLRSASELIGTLKNPSKKGWFTAHHHAAKQIRSLLGSTVDRMHKAFGRRRLPVLDSDTQARQLQIEAAADAIRSFFIAINPDGTVGEWLRRPSSQEIFEVLEKGLTGRPAREEIKQIARRYEQRVSRKEAEQP